MWCVVVEVWCVVVEVWCVEVEVWRVVVVGLVDVVVSGVVVGS